MEWVYPVIMYECRGCESAFPVLEHEHAHNQITHCPFCGAPAKDILIGPYEGEEHDAVTGELKINESLTIWDD